MYYQEGQEGLTYEQQREHIGELWQEVHKLAKISEMLEKTADYRARRIAEVDFYLQEESTWEQDTDTVLNKIAGILDIDVDVEKTVEMTVSFTMTVQGKRGADWSDLDAWAFSISDPETTLGDFEILETNYDIESVEVN